MKIKNIFLQSVFSDPVFILLQEELLFIRLEMCYLLLDDHFIGSEMGGCGNRGAKRRRNQGEK